MHHSNRTVNQLDICMDYETSNSTSTQPNTSLPLPVIPVVMPPLPPARPTSSSDASIVNSSPNIILSTGFHSKTSTSQSMNRSLSNCNHSIKRFEYTSEKHSKFLLESLSILRRRQELCDVVMIVGKKKIFAHRFLLAAYSPYFLGK